MEELIPKQDLKESLVLENPKETPRNNFLEFCNEKIKKLFMFFLYYLKKQPSIYLCPIIMVDVVLRIYYQGGAVFTKSEISIYCQAWLFCFLGLVNSSFILSGPMIGNILATYVANYLEMTLVKHTSNDLYALNISPNYSILYSNKLDEELFEFNFRAVKTYLNLG